MTLAQSLLGFTALATIVVVTPGLDTIFVLRQALRSGRRVAFSGAAGICLGALLWGIGAAAGVAALFVASQLAYAALRWAGVAFLAYLGFSYLRSAWRGPAQPEQLTSGESLTAGRAFVTGMLTDLLNPKMAVFYLTVLPLFLPAGYPPALAGALLAGVHAVVGMIWFAVVIFAAAAMRGILSRRRSGRVIDATAGVAMLGFGLALGLER